MAASEKEESAKELVYIANRCNGLIFVLSSCCEICLSPPRDVVDALPAHSGRGWQYFDWLPVGGGPRERFLSLLRDR